MSLILPLKRESDSGDEDIQPRICDIRSEATSTSMESTDDSRVFETFLSQLCNAELTSLNNSRNLQEELIVPHSVSYSSESSDLLPDDETLIVKELMSMIYNVIAKKSKIKKYVSDTNSVRFQIENAQNKSVVILHCAKLNVTSSKNLNDITTNNSNTTTTTTTSTNSSNINNNSNSNNNNCEIDTLRTIIKQEPSDSNYILPDGYIPVTEVTSSSPSFDERYLAASHSNESPSKVDPTNESLPVEQFEIDMQQNQSHVEESTSQVPTMKFSSSQKGNQVLTYMGFEYLSFRSINGVMSWRCRQSRSMKCHSIMKTKDNSIVQPPSEHCHHPTPEKAEANIARSKMREDMKVLSATPRSVMGYVLSELSNDVLAHMPKQSSIARNLRYHRKDNHLPNPTAVHFDIPEKYHLLVLHDSGVDDPDRILVLGDRELLVELNKDTIYGDGTFDKVPNMFFQLFAWHAKVGNSYPPCIYILIQKKNLDTYNRMFEIMKLLIPNLLPQKVLVDLDKDCMNAARIAFPHAEVKGCYFHLCQSLIKKITSVGLKTVFEADMNMKLKLKSLAALTFVPVHDVRSVFDELATTFPNEENYNEVLTFFLSTYIEGVAGRDPQFPITIWNHHDAALERSLKTTNCCEGFHFALNSLFHCRHSSVWFLFDGLQRDLASHRLTLAKARAGHPDVKKRRYDALLDLVATSVQEYEQVKDKLIYLRKLANLQ